MQRFLTLAFAVLMAFSTSAQAINPGFEAWSTGSIGGFTYDSLDGFDSHNRLMTVLVADDSVYTVMPLSTRPDLGIAPLEGSDALVLETKDLDILGGLITIPTSGTVTTQRIAVDIFAAEYLLLSGGSPYTDRPSSFGGMFIYHPVPNDTFFAQAVLTRNGAEIGRGQFQSGNTTPGWTAFSIDIAYTSPLSPDSIQLLFTSSKPPAPGAAYPVEGSYAIVDGFGEPCDPTVAPENLSTTVVPGGLALTWDAIPGSEGCRIRVVPDGGPHLFRFRPPGEFNTFVADAKIIPGVDYGWSVQCACSMSPLVLTPESAPDFFMARMGDPNGDHVLNAYPNPAFDQVRVPDFEIGSTVRIVDLLGRELAQQRVGRQGFVDLQGLPIGLLVLIADGGHAVVDHRP